MKLIDIEKNVYRKNLNRVIVCFIASFALLAVLFGQLFIQVLATPSGDNFWFNFSGVVLALVICLSLVNKFKHHPFMTEIYYVWQLKQQINFIYRKLTKIKSSAFNDVDIEALTILDFYYKACEKLYLLDDNTITLSSLKKEQKELEQLLRSYNLSVENHQYQQSLLAKF